MKPFVRSCAVLVSIGLAACSEAPPAAAERSTPEQITRANQGVLTDAQAAGINAANGVANVLEDAEKARQRQLEEATR